MSKVSWLWLKVRFMVITSGLLQIDSIGHFDCFTASVKSNIDSISILEPFN